MNPDRSAKQTVIQWHKKAFAKSQGTQKYNKGKHSKKKYKKGEECEEAKSDEAEC